MMSGLQEQKLQADEDRHQQIVEKAEQRPADGTVEREFVADQGGMSDDQDSTCGQKRKNDSDLNPSLKKQKKNHPPVNEKLVLDSDVRSALADAEQVASVEKSEDAEQAVPPNEVPTFSNKSLAHACSCKDANCELASCKMMKRMVAHRNACKKRASGGCPICKQLVALGLHHARNCQETTCPVPFCFAIKQKIKQHQERSSQKIENDSDSGPSCKKENEDHPLIKKKLVLNSDDRPASSDAGRAVPITESQWIGAHKCLNTLLHACQCKSGDCILVGCPEIKKIVEKLNTADDEQAVSTTEDKEFSVEKCIKSLCHACKCEHENCRLHDCKRMKKILSHIQDCKWRQSSECSVCDQIAMIFCHHARRCQEAKCPVPFCILVKALLFMFHHEEKIYSSLRCAAMINNAFMKITC